MAAGIFSFDDIAASTFSHWGTYCQLSPDFVEVVGRTKLVPTMSGYELLTTTAGTGPAVFTKDGLGR